MRLSASSPFLTMTSRLSVAGSTPAQRLLLAAFLVSLSFNVLALDLPANMVPGHQLGNGVDLEAMTTGTAQGAYRESPFAAGSTQAEGRTSENTRFRARVRVAHDYRSATREGGIWARAEASSPLFAAAVALNRKTFSSTLAQSVVGTLSTEVMTGSRRVEAGARLSPEVLALLTRVHTEPDPQAVRAEFRRRFGTGFIAREQRGAMATVAFRSDLTKSVTREDIGMSVRAKLGGYSASVGMTRSQAKEVRHDFADVDIGFAGVNPEEMPSVKPEDYLCWLAAQNAGRPAAQDSETNKAIQRFEAWYKEALKGEAAVSATYVPYSEHPELSELATPAGVLGIQDGGEVCTAPLQLAGFLAADTAEVGLLPALLIDSVSFPSATSARLAVRIHPDVLNNTWRAAAWDYCKAARRSAGIPFDETSPTPALLRDAQLWADLEDVDGQVIGTARGSHLPECSDVESLAMQNLDGGAGTCWLLVTSPREVAMLRTAMDAGTEVRLRTVAALPEGSLITLPAALSFKASGDASGHVYPVTMTGIPVVPPPPAQLAEILAAVKAWLPSLAGDSPVYIGRDGATGALVTNSTPSWRTVKKVAYDSPLSPRAQKTAKWMKDHSNQRPVPGGQACAGRVVDVTVSVHGDTITCESYDVLGPFLLGQAANQN